MNMNELSRDQALEVLKQAQQMLAIDDNNEATIRHYEQEIEAGKARIRSQYSLMSNLSVIFEVMKTDIMKYINKLLAIYKKEDLSEIKADLPQVNGIVLKKAKRICRSVLIGLIAGLVLGIISRNIVNCLIAILAIAVLTGVLVNMISDDAEIEKAVEEQIQSMKNELDMLVTKSQNYNNSEEMREMRNRIGGAYFNTLAVEQLISYFEAYRADTYKEAVNLYEAEKKKEEPSNTRTNPMEGMPMFRTSQNANINMPAGIPEEYRPISMWGYFGYELLFSIPLIGLVLLLVFAFGGTRNVNLKNFARGHFCGLIVLIAFFALFLPGLFNTILAIIF